jgi:hypothetical protein
MQKLLSTLLVLFLSTPLYGQQTEKVWRANVINPGVEIELPTSQKSTFSLNVGIGYSGSYPNLSETSFDSGGIYAIAPFADVQFKRFYNLAKRARKDKVTDNNSGNFVSIRFRSRGKSLDDNFERIADYDFAVGPTWGIQRSYGSFHLLFDVGPQFYFDSEGNTGFWPLMPQLNIGFDL